MHRLGVGAMILELLEAGEREAAEIVAVDFDCVLRGGEWQRIRAEDVDVGPDGSVAMRLGVIERGERVAQGVLALVRQVDWAPVDVLLDTERGSGGFGSTGTS